MFVKLAVFACAVAASSAAWNGPLAGGLPAAQFPAGISPEACPNFPNCDNPAVALTASAPAHGPAGYAAPNQYARANEQWNQAGQYGNGQQYSAGQYDNGQYDNGQYNHEQYDNGQYNHEQYNGQNNNGGYVNQAYNAAPAYKPAPAYNQAPAYNHAAAYNPAPAYNYNPQAYSAQAPAHAQPAQVPAGVDPSSCPNYPFCK